MNIPPDLVRLIHVTLSNHYRQYHRADNANRAEIFAETLGKKLLGPVVQADANRAVAHLEVDELPWVSNDADETYRLAGILREALCREIRQWLVQSGVWQYNVREKALAYARAVAIAADASAYLTALQNARRGYLPGDAYDGMSDEERRARQVEEGYSGSRGRW